MKTMYGYFQLGDKISGFCNGYFGRDDYENKVCVRVTQTYAVFEYEDEGACVLNLSEINLCDRLIINRWKIGK